MPPPRTERDHRSVSAERGSPPKTSIGSDFCRLSSAHYARLLSGIPGCRMAPDMPSTWRPRRCARQLCGIGVSLGADGRKDKERAQAPFALAQGHAGNGHGARAHYGDRRVQGRRRRLSGGPLPHDRMELGDGTISEAGDHCDPTKPACRIRRRFTPSHTYKRAGAYRISFRLKVKDRVLTSQTTMQWLLGGGF